MRKVVVCQIWSEIKHHLGKIAAHWSLVMLDKCTTCISRTHKYTERQLFASRKWSLPNIAPKHQHL